MTMTEFVNPLGMEETENLSQDDMKEIYSAIHNVICPPKVGYENPLNLQNTLINFNEVRRVRNVDYKGITIPNALRLMHLRPSRHQIISITDDKGISYVPFEISSDRYILAYTREELIVGIKYFKVYYTNKN